MRMTTNYQYDDAKNRRLKNRRCGTASNAEYPSGPMNRGMHAIAAAMDDEPCRSEPGRTRDAYDTAQWRTRRAQHGGHNATELLEVYVDNVTNLVDPTGLG
jgi:hypothetical protein